MSDIPIFFRNAAAEEPLLSGANATKNSGVSCVEGRLRGGRGRTKPAMSVDREEEKHQHGP